MNSPLTMKPGGSQELEEPAVNYPQGPARTMLERLCETLVLNAFEKMSFEKLRLSCVVNGLLLKLVREYCNHNTNL